MLIQNPKIKVYDETTSTYVLVNDVYSCVVAKSDVPIPVEASGQFVNETISFVKMKYLRGGNATLDAIKEGQSLKMQVFDGVGYYTTEWIVGNKKNVNIGYGTSKKTVCNIEFTPNVNAYANIVLEGGGTGGVTQEYVDQQDAIVLANSKTYTDSKLANKIGFASGTTKTGFTIGVDSDNEIYIEE